MKILTLLLEWGFFFGFFLRNLPWSIESIYMKKILLALLFGTQLLLSQVNIGVKNDVFVYTNSLVTNPSAFLQNSNPWEVNLVTADLFIQNNYAFISKQSLLGLSSTDNLVLNDTSNQSNLPKNTIGFSDHKNFDGHFQADVLGPAVAFKFKIKDHELAAGFYTRLRTFGNSFRLDNQYKYDNFINQATFSREFKPFSFSLATIQESSFFISKSFLQTKSSELNLGIAFKYSKVWDAVFVNQKNKITIDYDKASNSLLYSNYDADALFTTSYNFDKETYEPKNNGSALGIDLGLTYIDYGDYDKEEGEYLQKLAFSVSDIGIIKVNGEKHHFGGTPFVVNKNTDFNNVNDISGFFKELSTHVYGNPNTSLESNSFKIALPTSLHISYSGNLLKNRYITFGVAQRLPLYKYAFKSPNLFYVNFAKTHRIITYAAQFSMFEYKKPQIGGYLRIGPLILGSDNILPVFFKQDKLQSADIYLGIKIYPFWDNALSRRFRQKCDCEK